MKKYIGISVILLFLIIIAFITFFSTSPKQKITLQNTCQNITKSQALNIVNNLPEVKNFLVEMKQAKQPVITRAVQDGTNWSVQIAENHSDHLATFNWYTIDACNAKVKCSFTQYTSTGTIDNINSSSYPCQ